jgi:methylated-DNA-[protein]-cysteine S-methyltransferase
MTTSDQPRQTLQSDREAGQPPSPSIVDEAKQPGIDPCDVACDAMPGYLVGDLSAPEEVWLHEHTAACNYCSTMLGSYEEVNSALDDTSRPATTARPTRSVADALGLREARYGFLDTLVGPVLVAASDAGLCEVGYLGHRPRDEVLSEIETRGLFPVESQAAVRPATDQLGEYFAGHRHDFDLPIDYGAISPFTRRVLDATAAVPFGQVLTYGEIARRIGQPGASRAVGNALGRNPLPVVVPCHRIVRSDGSMGWYTGGVGIKRRLLAIEGVHFDQTRQLPLDAN